MVEFAICPEFSPELPPGVSNSPVLTLCIVLLGTEVAVEVPVVAPEALKASSLAFLRHYDFLYLTF